VRLKVVKIFLTRPIQARQVQASTAKRFSPYKWPLSITLLVIVTAAFSLSPLVDAAHPDAAVAASLRTSLFYDLVAPASNTLDALTLLTPAQYWQTFALCAAIFFGAGIVRDWRSARGVGLLRTMRAALRFALGTVAVIGIMLIATRPMAALNLSDSELIAVDFHSHTSASHDGRAGFDAEHNREWHRSAGFDAAYITDHRTFDGALDAISRNPATAGEGTVLLPGVELHDVGEHPLLLGVDPARMKISSPDFQGAAVKADGGPGPPILLLTMPGEIDRIPANELTGEVRVAGIEISDGCPRGMAQTATDHDRILALAKNLNVALVAGSDNHGWGRTAPAWSALRIPGWRNMSPGSLDSAIRSTIIRGSNGSAMVIARRTVAPSSGVVSSTLGGFSVGLMILRTMNARERLSWIAWSWSVVLVSLVRARLNRRRLRLAVRRRLKRRERRPLVDVAAAIQA
jgi:hypothetical protein